VRTPVHPGAGRVPRVEDRAVRAPELVVRVLGELAPGLVPVDALERVHERRQVVRVEVGVLRRPALLLERRERGLEAVRVDAVHHLAVHLDQASVRVVGEAAVAGRASEPVGRGVVETEVEDRVHHPRHRDGGARPHRDEERLRLVAEPQPTPLLEGAQVLVDLGVEPVGHLLALREVGAACVRRDREPRRHGHAELRHLGEPDPLAAEQLPTAVARLVEVVDVLRHARGSFHSAIAILPGWPPLRTSS
jgi:hypothetical protein